MINHQSTLQLHVPSTRKVKADWNLNQPHRSPKIPFIALEAKRYPKLSDIMYVSTIRETLFKEIFYIHISVTVDRIWQFSKSFVIKPLKRKTCRHNHNYFTSMLLEGLCKPNNDIIIKIRHVHVRKYFLPHDRPFHNGGKLKRLLRRYQKKAVWLIILKNDVFDTCLSKVMKKLSQTQTKRWMFDHTFGNQTVI